MSPSGIFSLSSAAGFRLIWATDSEAYQGEASNDSILWGRPASLAAHERRRSEAYFFAEYFQEIMDSPSEGSG